MKNAAIIAILALLTLIFSRLAGGLTPPASSPSNLPPTSPAAPTTPPSVSEAPTPTIAALPPNTQEAVIVSRVIDGDTVELEDNSRVRYIGMNTPELSDSRQRVVCFSREAMRRNRELVEGKSVWLEKDVSEQDPFGRLLRYVYIQDPQTGDATMVNLMLVREGFATTATYPPDVKYRTEISAAETEARNANRGLWAACPTK